MHDRDTFGNLLLFALIALQLGGPALPFLGQPPGYHAFADTRALAGIANAADVLSNLGFLLAALAGAWTLLRLPATAVARERDQRRACAVFFAGLALTAAGSAYYHLAPDDGRLVWDRLPMTIVFAGAFASVGAAKCPRVWSARLLVLMLLSAPMSVVWWAVSGNLAWYVAVQFGGLLWLAVSLLALRTRREQQPYVRAWLWALLCYGFAKGFELGDGVIWQSSGGLLGGHALKHLAAALPGFWLVLALRRAAEQQAGRPGAAADGAQLQLQPGT